jgi:membrane protease YdiL (CAAX protease family)
LRLTDFLLPDSFPFMNDTDVDSSAQSKTSGRLRAVFEIVLVSGIISGLLASLVFALILSPILGRNNQKLMEMDAGFFTAYALFETAVAFIIMLMLMKTRLETFSMLGLRWEQWKTDVLLGVLAAPCLVVVTGFVGLIFRLFLPEYALEKNPLLEMIGSPRQLMLFIIIGTVAGGIKEELQRAFILRRFSRHLGGAGTGLVIWSLAFGAGHSAQGLQGICSAAILGLVFGAIYLIRGNLVLPITAHAVYNTLVMLLYWFTIGTNKQIP